MRLTSSLGLALVATALAAPAFAGGGCNYGHYESASVVASAEPAQSEAPMISEPVDGTMVAQLDCTGLTGDALVECAAKTSN